MSAKVRQPTAVQSEIDFEQLSAREKRRRSLYGWPELLRRDIWRHRREGLPVYHPLECRRQILAILADGQWHGFISLCNQIGMGAEGIGHVLDDVLLRYGRIEKREHYFGAPSMMPEVHPGWANYRGFQWAYRLTQK